MDRLAGMGRLNEPLSRRWLNRACTVAATLAILAAGIWLLLYGDTPVDIHRMR